MSGGERRVVSGIEAETAIRDHLANERTMPAWQRTALGVAGIGFLVDRFALVDSAPTVLGSLIGVAHVLSAGGDLSRRRGALPPDGAGNRYPDLPAPFAHLALTAAIVLRAVVLAAYLILTPRQGDTR